jgi:hypothetical protein
MRRLATILLLLATTPALATVETVDNTLGTGEVMAFGLNTYLVYLEISELTADTPSWVLGTAGLVVGASTLALKDYDGTVFSSFQTTMASANLLMGAYLVYQARRADESALSLRPIIGPRRVGLSLDFRF